jgi:hypothetical protein
MLLARTVVCLLVCWLSASCGQSPAADTADQFLTRVRDAQTSQADPRALRTLEYLGSELPEGAVLDGVEDIDEDARDDDGLVEVKLGKGTACVILPNADSRGQVSDGPCG